MKKLLFVVAVLVFVLSFAAPVLADSGTRQRVDIDVLVVDARGCGVNGAEVDLFWIDDEGYSHETNVPLCISTNDASGNAGSARFIIWLENHTMEYFVMEAHCYDGSDDHVAFGWCFAVPGLVSHAAVAFDDLVVDEGETTAVLSVTLEKWALDPEGQYRCFEARLGSGEYLAWGWRLGLLAYLNQDDGIHDFISADWSAGTMEASLAKANFVRVVEFRMEDVPGGYRLWFRRVSDPIELW